jgi:hypothetical protein
MRLAFAVALGLISRRAGFSLWWGFGVMVPIVGPLLAIGWIWYMAFARWPRFSGNLP